MSLETHREFVRCTNDNDGTVNFMPWFVKALACQPLYDISDSQGEEKLMRNALES